MRLFIHLKSFLVPDIRCSAYNTSNNSNKTQKPSQCLLNDMEIAKKHFFPNAIPSINVLCHHSIYYSK